MEVTRDLGIEARAAGCPEAHLLAQVFVNFAEQNRPSVDSHLAQSAIDRRHGSKNLLRKSSSFCDLLEYALMNQVIKLWYHGEGGNVALVKRPQELGCIQSFQVNHARAL